MDRRLLGTLGAGALILLLTVWVLYPHRPRPGKGRGEEYRFMHCWECKKEIPYNAQRLDKGCPQCEGPLTPTTRSVEQSGQLRSPLAQMLVPLLLELTVLLAIVVYLGTQPRRTETEEEYLRVRCPQCDRKLRYAVRKAGQPGQCPGCKRGLVFPPLGAEQEA